MHLHLSCAILKNALVLFAEHFDELIIQILVNVANLAIVNVK